MKLLKLISSLLIFLTVSYLGYKVIKTSMASQKYKNQYAELHHFQYGLFSVNAWKEQISEILIDEIDKLHLTKRNKATLLTQLEKQLSVFIDQVYARIQESNKDSLLKNSILKSLVDIDEIKKGIPEYARTIMAEVATSKSEAQVKTLLKSKIDSYLSKTHDTFDTSLRDKIIKDTGSSGEKEAKLKIQRIMTQNHRDLSEKAILLIILAVLLFAIEGMGKGSIRPPNYIILTLTLLVLMIVGITTPMIDMEARISQLTFVLFDHSINFADQVLYFQSKSILDVFWVMITHKTLQMKAVGLLVVAFSVFFPILKLASSMAYYYDYKGSRKSPLIHFFVIKSGKWSMADVLVVAIFMAYIGFNGIINSQLADMAAEVPTLSMVTTNGTSLQPGYYIFLTYTLLAMTLSGFLNKKPHLEGAVEL